MEYVIETEFLSKRYGSVKAVDEISMRLRPGEIYGFLGLNGAGKTTLIRLLLGMIRPGQGTVKLFGHPIQQASNTWNDIGYMVETPSSYPNLTVKENLEIYRMLRGLKDKAAVAHIIDTLELSAYSGVKAKHLSLGNNQRLGLAKALIHKPKLLILDEPINGLDPAGIVKIRQYLKYLVQEQGCTIFLSSHILTEIAKLATRIGIVHHGRLIHEINTDALHLLIRRTLIIDTIDNDRASAWMMNNDIEAIRTKAGILTTTNQICLDQPELLSENLCKAGLFLKSYHITEEDLESFFLRMIQLPDHQPIS